MFKKDYFYWSKISIASKLFFDLSLFIIPIVVVMLWGIGPSIPAPTYEVILKDLFMLILLCISLVLYVTSLISRTIWLYQIHKITQNSLSIKIPYLWGPKVSLISSIPFFGFTFFAYGLLMIGSVFELTASTKISLSITIIFNIAVMYAVFFPVFGFWPVLFNPITLAPYYLYSMSMMNKVLKGKLMSLNNNI